MLRLEGRVLRPWRRLEQDDLALKCLERQLLLLQNLPDRKDDLPEVLGNLGVMNYRLKHPDEALTYLSQAIEAAQDANQPEILGQLPRALGDDLGGPGTSGSGNPVPRPSA